MTKLQKLIELARKQVGYCEKASNSQLDDHTANAGYNNYTKFSRDISNAGLQGYNGSAWCISFQFWLDLTVFGKDKALSLWNMTDQSYVGYNCFSTYNIFKEKGKVGKTPKLGALVIFNYSHAGRVIDIYTKNGVKYIEVIEGNTSSVLNDRNGGTVAIKTRLANESVIKGYCYIDYDDNNNEENESSGWIKTDDGSWKFVLGDTKQCITNDWWLNSNGLWSYFNQEGIAKCNEWFCLNNRWYYADSDCYCITSQWLQSNEKWYYLTADGSMATNSLIRSKDVGLETYYYVDQEGAWDGHSYLLTSGNYQIAI